MSRTLFTESTKVIDPQPLIYLKFDVSDTINISITIVIPLFKFLQLRTPNERQCLVPNERQCLVLFFDIVAVERSIVLLKRSATMWTFKRFKRFINKLKRIRLALKPFFLYVSVLLVLTVRKYKNFKF